MNEYFKSATPVTRQVFLIQLAFWSGWGALGLALLKHLTPPELVHQNQELELGSPEAFAVGSVTFFALHKAWLVRTSQGFYALQAVCPHLGCQPHWQTQQQHFFCPCHGSRFSEQGELQQGPARRSLARFQIFLNQQQQIVINLEQTYQAEQGEWSESGAFLSWPNHAT